MTTGATALNCALYASYRERGKLRVRGTQTKRQLAGTSQTFNPILSAMRDIMLTDVRSCDSRVMEGSEAYCRRISSSKIRIVFCRTTSVSMQEYIGESCCRLNRCEQENQITFCLLKISDTRASIASNHGINGYFRVDYDWLIESFENIHNTLKECNKGLS